MILGNDTFRLSNRTEIFGPMHGNEGVRFDGVAHNSTSSGVTCYNDPDTPGGGACERPGVWSGEWPGSEPYNTLLSNPVFLGGRNFPIPKIDFNSVTADLAYMKSEAQTSGEAAHYYGPSGAGYRGYRIEFKPTGYEITKVKTVDDKDSVTRVDTPSRISRSFPSKGLIFVEDNVWFNGKGVAGVKVETERMTIAVADLLGGSDPNIYIEDGAQYKNGGSGQEALGFIAEGSIGFPGDCQNTLTLHGALLAQKGAVQRAHYGSAYNKNKITIFGAIASKGRIGFGYTDGTGFQNRELLFDANLTVSPPPYFPTGTQYSIDLWEEL
ncbi:MAG: hypothetical protein IPL87_02420 [Candidatus Moraniibacteriota bacterium]|nr:MAG: hypothetical protein IPL87_02420 [Candidatus Moranbacteria bacterium]